MNTLVSPTDKTALHGSKTHTCIIRWTQILASLFEKREKKKKKKKKKKEKTCIMRWTQVLSSMLPVLRVAVSSR